MPDPVAGLWSGLCWGLLGFCAAGQGRVGQWCWVLVRVGFCEGDRAVWPCWALKPCVRWLWGIVRTVHWAGFLLGSSERGFGIGSGPGSERDLDRVQVPWEDRVAGRILWECSGKLAGQRWWICKRETGRRRSEGSR